MRRRLLVAVVFVAAAGCVTKRTVTTIEPPATRSPDNVLDRMLHPDNGLVLRKWVVTGDSASISSALSYYQHQEILGPDEVETFRRNGLRFVQVREDRLDDLLAALGINPYDLVAWHGQILEWRELYHRQIAGPGTALAVAGRVRAIPPGRLRIMGRSWTVLMEDGPYLSLELLTVLNRPQVPSLSQLLGDPDLQGEVIDQLSVEVELRNGYAYILTGESPATTRERPAPDEPRASKPASVGPDADTPDTVGEFLFANHAEPSTHTLLVFIPRIPERLLRPYRLEGTTPEGQPVAATR